MTFALVAVFAQVALKRLNSGRRRDVQRIRPAPRSEGGGPGASSSRRRGACPLVPASPLGATEGSRGSGRGGGGGGSGGAIRARGSLPNPAVPAANCTWSDGCPRGENRAPPHSEKKKQHQYISTCFNQAAEGCQDCGMTAASFWVATGVPPPMTAVCRKLTWSWEAGRRHVGFHLDKPQKDSSSEGPANLRPDHYGQLSVDST
nr:uncharacterized protein LOC129481531 [Symphalangus syndactylus]